MKYLTAIELSEKWKITSRMITIHCKKGRISGAIKKGKLWLIPADAQKPGSKRKVISNTINIDENIAEEGVLAVMNKVEATRTDTTFYSETLYRHFGFTRETLRYYEKIGLIEPNRKIENSYREFGFHDIEQFLIIDFYKKHGFNLSEIKKLMKQSNFANTSISFNQKAIEIEQNIYDQQRILARLNETKKIFKDNRLIGENLEIRDFPLYSVLKSCDYFTDISNYGDNIFGKLDREDLLSHLIRATSFDDIGYKGTKICIVKKATEDSQDSQEKFLESGRSAYTAGFVDDLFDERIFHVVHKWLNEHGFKHKGIAYFIYRFISVEENKTYRFAELWIPIK